MPGEAQLIGKFVPPEKRRSLFRCLVGNRSPLLFATCKWSLLPLLHSRGLAPALLSLCNKQPDRPHQMLGGNIDIPFDQKPAERPDQGDGFTPEGAGRAQKPAKYSNRELPYVSFV